MHCLTVVWNCRDGALPICWPLLSCIVPILFAYSLACHSYIFLHFQCFLSLVKYNMLYMALLIWITLVPKQGKVNVPPDVYNSYNSLSMFWCWKVAIPKVERRIGEWSCLYKGLSSQIPCFCWWDSTVEPGHHRGNTVCPEYRCICISEASCEFPVGIAMCTRAVEHFESVLASTVRFSAVI